LLAKFGVLLGTKADLHILVCFFGKFKLLLAGSEPFDGLANPLLMIEIVRVVIELPYFFVHIFNKVAIHQLFHEYLTFQSRNGLNHVTSHKTKAFANLQFIKAGEHHVGVRIHWVHLVFIKPR
jgi:hypothetical protein